MYDELKQLVRDLKSENQKRSEKMNKGVSDYDHTVLVHTYNNTLDFIKRMEKIIGVVN